MLQSLRQKAIASLLVSAALVAALAGTALWSSAALTEMSAAKSQMAQVLQRHMQADMMHDALRGDLLAALQAAPDDAEAHNAAEKDVTEHADEFRSDIKANRETALPPAIAKRLADIGPRLEAYVQLTTRLVPQARRDRAGVEREMAHFTEIFSELEESMAAASEAIIAEVEATQEQAVATESQARLLVLLAIAAAAVALAVTYYLIIHGALLPITRMTAAMSQLAEGDLRVSIHGRDRRDEIGQMAHALAVFRDNAERNVRLESERKAAETAAAAERRAAIESLANTFEVEVGGVIETVATEAANMRGTARHMMTSASALAEQSESVSVAASQASGNVQHVAAAAEQLQAAISEIARHSAQSNVVSLRAVELARGADAKVTGLQEAAQRVGTVVDLIRTIASQTNLLALNATIEAARAGEAGKGFAVVATEVKSLANETAKATEDIAEQITAIQAATGDAAQSLQDIANVIEEVNASSSTIAAAVEEQSVAVQEISGRATETSASTDQVGGAIHEVTRTSQEVGDASRQVEQASESLAAQSTVMQEKVRQLLARVRAG